MSIPMFLLVFSVTCALFSSTAAVPRTYVDDGLALLAFKAAITDDPLGALVSWKETLFPDPCTGWEHVVCDANLRVDNITLNNLSLAGRISSALGSLDQLTNLDLSMNLLQGSIPSTFGNLTNLEFLDLSYLDFTDPEPLPSSLGDLSNLHTLFLQYSNIHGSIPSSFGKLSSLNELHMSNNNLTSLIPIGLSHISNLTILDLSSNYLSSPFPAELPSSLQNLYLSSNNFSGPIPDCLLRLPNIITISLENNRLSGPIPAGLGNLSTMLDLGLGGNQLTGTIPKGLGELALLFMLDFSSNNLGGPLPSDFQKIGGASATGSLTLNLKGNAFTGFLPHFSENQSRMLTELDVSGNGFSGPIPESYANFTQLNILSLQDNNLTGSIPPGIFEACSLSLNVSNNHLSGTLPSRLFNNINVSSFSAAGNNFSGPLPSSLNQPGTSLQFLEIQNNKFSGLLPVLDQITTLQILNIGGNNFSGPIPTNFLNWTEYRQGINLNYVDMRDNRLNGSIPPQFGGIPSLNYLRLSNNSFTGVLPLSLLGPNSTLVTLDVRNNALHGPLNFSSSQIRSLQSLSLSGNAFNGTFPTAISNFGTLQFLNLSHNKFEGPLPEDLGSLPALLSLSLDNNSFTGPLPTPLFLSSQLLLLSASHNRLNGTLPPQIGLINQTLLLDLHSNLFSGPIPENISRLQQVITLDLSDNRFNSTLPPSMAGLSHLQYFNVSQNLLTGALPGGNLTTSSSSSSYLNNTGGLCGAPLPPCPTHLSAGAIAGIVIGAVTAVAILVGVAVYLYLRQRRFGPDGGELVLFFPLPVTLTYKDILVATDNWGEKSLLGVGGFGSVYKAELKDGKTAVAIKRLAQGSSQGLAELKAEMNTLGKLKHKNLVRLIGSYISTTESLLIYELLAGGDLDSYLFEEKKVFEEWSVRLNILLGSARGFKYLHHDTTPAIIHRDIKPPNILIDDNLEARVADFGLAETIDLDEHTHLSTSVSGTVGYLAPEYSAQGKLTTKSDVYAFGVVILQVMTGRRPTDKAIGDSGLTKWVSSHWANNEAIKVIDPRLRLEESIISEVSGALKLGLMCTSRNMRDRPSMEDVVHLLENLDMFGGMDRFDMNDMEDDRSDVYSIGSSSQPNSSANVSMLNVIMEARE